MDKHYEVTPRTIVFGLAILAGIWVLVQIKLVVVAVFIAMVLSLALNPLVMKLQLRRVPRPLAVFLVFFIFLFIIGGLLVYGFTPLVNQTGRFVINIPQYFSPVIDRLGPLPFAEELRQQLVSQATLLSANILAIAGTIVSNVLFLLMVLILSFYLLLDWENLLNRFVGMLNVRAKERVLRLAESMEHQLGGWLRGQLTLMVVVGVMVYLGLLALGVEYALPLAVIAGLLEIVPVIGPILSAVPALLVGFGTSIWLGVWVAVLYLVVQQLENSLIVPNVMGRAIGFSPLLTLLILLAGGQLFGIGGALLAIPASILLLILARDILVWNHNRRN